MPSASPPWTILKINKEAREGNRGLPVPLPDNGLLHALRFSTISSRLPPPREEPGPCPGSLRFQPSRTAPRCPFRKRAEDRRLPVRGSARHAVNENTGSGHAYAARSRPSRVPPYGITLLILAKRHTIPQKIRQMPGLPRKGFPVHDFQSAESWLRKALRNAPKPLPSGVFPKLLDEAEQAGFSHSTLNDVVDEWLNFGYWPRHRPRLQRHRTDAGRGRVLRAPNH